MNDYILWTIDHFNKKNQEIVSTEFITEIGTTMLEILDFVTNTPVLCYPNDCDPINHKIEQKSINDEEFDTLYEIGTVEFKDLKTVEGIWDIDFDELEEEKNEKL